MSTQQVLRAWRDHDYWLSLGESERARIPANPAGLVELMDEELEVVAGAHTCPGEFSCDHSCAGTCDGCTNYSNNPCCY